MNVRQTYHHGDLRTALVAEGLLQLEQAGEGELSLRALAKATGVSPNAPYRHFADKSSLMGALAAEGFRRFADAVTARAEEPGGGPAGLAEAIDALRGQARAYLVFALANPALYRLMFSPYGYSLKSESCQFEAERAFQSLVTGVAGAQANGWKHGQDLAPVVLFLWSALHGWAGLLSDNLLPPAVQPPELEAWLNVMFQESSG